VESKKIVVLIARTEIFIGIITIASLLLSPLFTGIKKPGNVFMFILVASLFSSIIGIGLLMNRGWARKLLIFFSTYIVLTKMLIFSDLLYFSGEILTFIPYGFKNFISVIYHCFIIVFFNRKTVKAAFKK